MKKSFEPELNQYHRDFKLEWEPTNYPGSVNDLFPIFLFQTNDPLERRFVGK
jgi:hypothetical protein